MKLLKKGDLYYPPKEFKKEAWVSNRSIYKEAARDPIRFWENAAKELVWFKKWKKTFVHKPPYFQWFVAGKINITFNALDRHLKQRKNKVALIWEPEPLQEKRRLFTYYELYKQVNKFANALKSLGVRKGDRVAIYLPMIPEAMISMLGCARIGAVHSVVFSAFAPQSLRIRLQNTGAKILITSDGYYRRGKVINLKENADKGIKDTEVKKVIVVRRMGNKIPFKKGRDVWWEDVIKGQPDYCKPAIMDSEDPLFILPESGTGGEFLPILHTTGGYTVQAYLTGKWIFDLHEGDIMWSTADIGWITGHTYSIYSPLLNGITTLMFEGAIDFPTPDRWAKIIEKYGVTIFYTAPTAVRMFKKQMGTVKQELSTLKIIASVGEPINEKAWRWYFKNVGKQRCPVLDTWWQTETGGIVISSLPAIGPFKPTFAGLPFPGIRVEILDDKGKPCKVNQQGNLVILPPFAPGMLRGVYKSPKKYLKTYWSQYAHLDIIKGKIRPAKKVRGKIYFTSDGAYKDKNGLIRIVGRVDDVIKVAGHRFTTGELEDAITKNEKINECAVIGVPDEIKGQVPVAFVILKETSSSLSEEEIKQEVRNEVRKRISPTAVPKEVYLVKDLPRTRSGKIMRPVLRRLFAGEKLGDLSTLANPETIEEIKNLRSKVESTN